MKMEKVLAVVLLLGLFVGVGTHAVIASTVQDAQSESVTSEDENVLVETDSAGPDDEIYVYDGETFYEDGVSPYARVAAGKINYTYWAIHGGADFGDILEDGRNLDHLGIIMLKTGKNWKTAYCIHHNANLQGGHNYADVESYLTDTEKKELTGLALYNGFKFDGWTPDDDTVPDDADKGKYTATQVMVWIIEKGWYTYDKNNCSFIIQSKAVSVAKTICAKSDQSPSGSSYSYFNQLYAAMQKHDQMPSFVNPDASKAQTKNMGYDFSKKQYRLVITDENHILSECSISGAPDGLKVQKNGNQLVLTSSVPLNQAVTLKIEKQSFQPETAITIWSDQDDKNYQQIGTYAEPNISILTGYLKITTALSQVSAEKVWEDNHNKNQKRPEQIELKLYRGSKKHEKASLVQTITLNEKNNWKTAVSNLPAFDASGNHIFYTMEEKKVNGYEGSVQEKCSDEYHWQYIFKNTENTGSLKLFKKSSNPELTEGNECYSLEGAEYGVYEDEACTKSVGKLVTDQNGNTNVLAELREGTYYVKETKRPKGYKLDENIYETRVLRGDEKMLELTDVPVFSSLIWQVEKLAADEISDPKRFPLTGTEFTIDFYPEYGAVDMDKKKPARSWVVQVTESISEGKIMYHTSLKEENLIKAKSDPLFMDKNGSNVMPLGTVMIRETAPASDYKLEGYVTDNEGRIISENPTEATVIEVKDDNGEAVLMGMDGISYKNSVWKVYNKLYPCSIQIIKSDAVRQPLSGVWFALLDEDQNQIAEGKTDQKGKLIFDHLLPGRYQLIEIKTTDGQQLLKEPADILLPLELTEEEIKSGKIDKMQCVYDEKAKVYKVYDRVYEIGNSGGFVLPMTGGTEKLSDYFVLLAGLACFSLAAVWLIRKKEKFGHHSFDNIP